jgi:hypothetical protein
MHPCALPLELQLDPQEGCRYPAQRPYDRAYEGPPCTESPFARTRRYLAWSGFSPLRPALPGLHCSYGLMRQAGILQSSSGFPLIRPVLAGCCEPLLDAGLSRRYLRSLSMGAWTPTPSRSPGASARFFPEDIGLTSRLTRSARESLLQSSFHRTSFSGVQSFANVQAPIFARPPGCSHRCGTEAIRAAGPFTPRNGHVVTDMNRGIATCLNRATGTAGLSPARLRPCRPLHNLFEVDGHLRTLFPG